MTESWSIFVESRSDKARIGSLRYDEQYDIIEKKWWKRTAVAQEHPL